MNWATWIATSANTTYLPIYASAVNYPLYPPAVAPPIAEVSPDDDPLAWLRHRVSEITSLIT
jgi:hypothetical protein